MRLLPVSCPYCHQVHAESDAVTGEDGPPAIGDVLICETCRNCSILESPGLARKPTEEERALFLNDEDITQALRELR